MLATTGFGECRKKRTKVLQEPEALLQRPSPRGGFATWGRSNGRRLDEHQARLSLTEAGLLMADCVLFAGC